MNAPFVPSSSRVRLLVFDVDGTLTNASHEVPEATRSAVERLRTAGVRMMIATGRRYRDALPVARHLGIDVPLVSASGALVKRPSDHLTLARATFAPGVLPEILRLIGERGADPQAGVVSVERGRGVLGGVGAAWAGGMFAGVNGLVAAAAALRVEDDRAQE